MKALLVSLLFLAPYLSWGKEASAMDAKLLKHPVKAALWKIDGPDLKKPSYLFGTLHLGDPRVTTLHPKAEEAFKEADHFYAEIDLDPQSQFAIIPKLMRTDNKTLTESIGPKLAQKLNTAFKDINPALSAAPFNTMKTWVVYATLPILELQMSGKKALDVVLYERAMKEGKEVGALETADSQLKIFDEIKEEDQVKLLAATLKLLKEEKKSGENSMEELLNLYLTDDIAAIGKTVKDYMKKEQDGANAELSTKLMKALLDDRNVTMADTIVTKIIALPEHSHFFAVGAAHYTGATAIQDLLSKKGYTITPAFK